MKLILSFIIPILLSSSLAIAQDATTSQRELMPAPIHNVELGMDIRDANAALIAAGFIRKLDGFGAQTKPFEYNLYAEGENNVRELFQLYSSQVWSKDGIDVEVRWTGGDPEGKDYRKIDGDGKVWFISRNEFLREPSSFDVVYTDLQQRFGFKEVRCDKESYKPSMRSYGVHVNKHGTGNETSWLSGTSCSDPIGFAEIQRFIGKGLNFDPLVDVSLVFDIDKTTSGLVSQVNVNLFSPRLVMMEGERFYNLVVNEINSRKGVGVGLSDF